MKEWVRLGLMRLLSFGFRLGAIRCTLDDRALLIISPHPDDDILGCGGLIAAKVERGATVHVIFLTDGAASHPNHPTLSADALSIQRKREAKSALSHLGVRAEQISFLNLPDGRLDRLTQAEKDTAMRQLQEKVQSDSAARIFIPLANEGSSEHRAANELIQEALRMSSPDFVEYAVWAWWDPRRLLPLLWKNSRPLRFELGSFRQLKRVALAQHLSQTEAVPPWTVPTLPRSLVYACCGPRELYFPLRNSDHAL